MNKEKPFKKLFKMDECLIKETICFTKQSQCILIGGGTSIKEGLLKELWDKLKDKFVIGLNYSYLYFSNPTIQCFVDCDFYKDELNKLKDLHLIIGKWHKNLVDIKHPSTALLQVNDSKYYRNLSEGVYKSSLCGIFSLSLAIYLLNFGKIFLLGFDHSDDGTKDDKGRRNTHFYQKELIHRGCGKINYYNTKGRADKDFGVYDSEKQCKIYNVSLNSKIEIFPKISYDKFFSMLDNNIFDQNGLRKRIKQKLKDKIL